MRLIQNKDTNNPPSSLVNAMEEQNEIARTKDKDSISAAIYKGDFILIEDEDDPYCGQKEHEVRYQLRKYFYNKCAYCECTEYKPDVEHYRPKKEVTGNKRNKDGYYWLCYEWTNLLPACSACNRPPGKGTKFPIEDTRLRQPPFDEYGNLDSERCRVTSNYLLQEAPLLLHPEVDNPIEYFKLDFQHKNYGKLFPLDENSQKAKKSIKVYDLNRGNLKIARADILDDLKKDILEHFEAFRKDEIVEAALQIALKIPLRKLKRKQAPETPYSFVYYYICAHFEEFVSDFLKIQEPLEAQLLIQVFNRI